DELKRYFADPAGYARDLTTTLVTRYASAGHARAKRRDTAGAMELYSRVLELDPANADVKAALDRLGRGRRTAHLARLALAAVAGAALLVVVGTPAYRWLTQPTPTPTTVAVVTPPPATETPVAIASATATARPSPSATLAHATPSRAPSATPAASAAPSATQVALLVPSPAPTATPPPALPPGKGGFAVAIDVAAEIFVDSEKVGDTVSMKNKPIPLDPGPHAVHIAPLEGPAKAGCKPLDGTIKVEAGRVERSLHQTVFGTSIEIVLPPEEIYLSGCPILFRLDAGGASAAVTEVRLDGRKLSADDEGNWKGISGEHLLTILAKNYESLEVPVKLHARQELGDKGPARVSVELVRKKP
ncbi:MAG TPA: hypothetical protein VMV18_03160, partial [bacterium]|nr:hypothetical protein [bacterium]